MSAIQNAIEVRNLTKVFSGRVLFENFSLNVKAKDLYISERTLYNHIQNIYEKLDATNSIEAYNKAIILGYINPLM